METHVLTLPDGRRVAWSEQGDPEGLPVLTLHGSPGSRLNRIPAARALTEAGVRQITYDRPGYGLSDPWPGRCVADVAVDAGAVLDAAGVDRVVVSGGSGGGPHALAVASLLPDRCHRVLCSAGVAPFDGPDLDFFSGMDPANIERFTAASAGRYAAMALLGPQLEEALRRGAVDPETVLGTMELPERDRAVLRTMGPYLLAAAQEAAVQGATGWADDMVAMTGPWGFDLAAISCPVHVEYGLKDVNVPPGHGEWLAGHVPNAIVHVEAHAGHLRTADEQVARLLELAATA